jgi:hypothetical protein
MTNKVTKKKGEIPVPFGDGTGPRGRGPLTGRRLGYCAGFPAPGAFSPFGYGGYGGGFGQGRGFRHRYWATGTPGWAWSQGAAQSYPVMPPFYPAQQVAEERDEGKVLRQQAAYLKEQLADIERRLGELEKLTGDEDK